MNQQEWIEYFELVNGRKPTPAELAQAQAAGEFILERPNVFWLKWTGDGAKDRLSQLNL